jgi:LEA14-like dessication related protein
MHKLNRLLATASWLIAVVFMQGCANLQSDFETPSVQLVSLQALPANGLEQRFTMGLRVANPNGLALNLVGMSYSIELEGFKLVTGVSNDIPSIAAYGEGLVNVEASVSLIDGVRLINGLLSKPQSELNYKIGAKLDTGLPFIGKIPVTDTGVINLAR